MPRAKASAPAPSVDPKRRKLLEAAFTTFVRYGFRKTSMEEVARAAQVSRQGLYLHFSTKEELFRAGAELALAEALGRAQASLKSPKLSLEARLVGALDAWFGEYVGATPPASDLFVEEYEARFDDALTQAIRRSALASAHRLSGLGARELAFTLQAAARGHKYTALSRKDFVHGVTLAARALLTPLKGRR
jgi:AcrR family transcriptional regulator